MEIRRATEEDILYIAANLRKSDRREIWASHRRKPEDLLESCRDVEVWAAVAEGTVCIFGCNILGCGANAACGVPWLLATDEVLKHRVQFLRTSRQICRMWLEKHRLLTNFVHAENKLCILWLKWLGFEFPGTAEFNGEKFLRFEKRWQDV